MRRTVESVATITAGVLRDDAAVPIDERAKEILESLVARIDIDDYVARVEAGIRDMPEYQGFVDGRAELDDRGRAGIRWNLEIFLRWARDGQPLSREDRARLSDLVGARAAEGRPPEEGFAVYRQAMRVGWEVMLERADEQERAAIGGAFDVLLEWVDVVSRVFEEAYSEERDAHLSQRERRARWLFDRITLQTTRGRTISVWPTSSASGSPGRTGRRSRACTMAPPHSTFGWPR